MTYVATFRQTPDLDNAILHLETKLFNKLPGDRLTIQVYDGAEIISELTQDTHKPIDVKVASPKPWNPSSPQLYDLKVTLSHKGKTIDEVGSYFAMRKISTKKEYGIERLKLINEFLFQYGLLNQGWWPDSLATASTDEV